MRSFSFPFGFPFCPWKTSETTFLSTEQNSRDLNSIAFEISHSAFLNRNANCSLQDYNVCSSVSMYKTLWISPWLPMNCVRLVTERKMGDEWIEKLAPFTFTQGHPVTALHCLGPHNPLEGRDTTNQYLSVIAFILSWRKFGTASVHRTWGLTNGLMNMTFYSVTCPQSLKVPSPQHKQVLMLRIVVTKY